MGRLCTNHEYSLYNFQEILNVLNEQKQTKVPESMFFVVQPNHMETSHA